MYYWTCPLCGSNLDRNEKCDCQEEKARKMEFFSRNFRMEPKSGQMVFAFDGERKEVSYGG